MEERVHENTGRTPKNMKRIEVSYDVACEVYEFLKNYSNIHGMPSPGRNFNRTTIPVVFLPTSYNYYSVYRDYVIAYKDKHGIEARIMVESTFTKMWKALIPELQSCLQNLTCVKHVRQ